MKNKFAILFIAILWTNTLLSQDTSLVDFTYTDINGIEKTEKLKSINYIGMVYPRIYEKTVTGNYFNGLSLRDSIVVINLWDTHCAPCIAEMPGLNKLKEDYKKKPVVFIAMTTDDPKVVFQKFISTKRFEFLHLFLDNEDKKSWFYLAQGYPTTLIIDRNSKISFMTCGGQTNDQAPKEIYDKLSVEIDKLLK